MCVGKQLRSSTTVFIMKMKQTAESVKKGILLKKISVFKQMQKIVLISKTKTSAPPVLKTMALKMKRALLTVYKSTMKIV